jgi:phage gp29-like protein
VIITPTKGGTVNVKLDSKLAVAPFVDRYQRILGGSLTPQNVTPILSNADIGYMWQLADLLDEIRERDPHTHTVLAKREMAVAGSDWEMRPPEKSGAKGDEIAEFCAERLREVEADSDLDRRLEDLFADLMGACYVGRAVDEVTWRKDGKFIVPDKFTFVHPRRLAIISDWRLHIWDSQGTAGNMYQPVNVNGSPFGQFPGMPLEGFPPGKFIVHRPRIRGTYPTKEGLGRGLIWFAMFKRFAFRDFVAFAEWAGRGLRMGKYGTGTKKDGLMRATPEDVAALQNALDAITSQISAVFPDNTEADIRDAPQNNDVHEKLILACNNEISKGVLGETLTTEVGMTGGNRALGDIHNEVRLMIARNDARALAATLRHDLLKPLVWLNFGKGAPVPEIAFAVDPKADLDAKMARLEKFVKVGGIAGQRTSRNELDIPDPEPDEGILIPPAPMMPDVVPFRDDKVEKAPPPAPAASAAPPAKKKKPKPAKTPGPLGDTGNPSPLLQPAR